jgi:hypothetical protein
MVKAGTVPGSRSCGGCVVDVTGADVVVARTVEPVDVTMVELGAPCAAVDGDEAGSSRVTRKTARARTNPAATTNITWPARSFILSAS